MSDNVVLFRSITNTIPVHTRIAHSREYIQQTDKHWQSIFTQRDCGVSKKQECFYTYHLYRYKNKDRYKTREQQHQRTKKPFRNPLEHVARFYVFIFKITHWLIFYRYILFLLQYHIQKKGKINIKEKEKRK